MNCQYLACAITLAQLLAHITQQATHHNPLLIRYAAQEHASEIVMKDQRIPSPGHHEPGPQPASSDTVQLDSAHNFVPSHREEAIDSVLERLMKLGGETDYIKKDIERSNDTAQLQPGDDTKVLQASDTGAQISSPTQPIISGPP